MWEVGGSRLRDICTGSKRSVDMAERTGGGVNCWPHALCVNNPTHCQFAGQPQYQGSASWTLQGGLTQSVVNIFPFVFGCFVFEDTWRPSDDDDKDGEKEWIESDIRLNRFFCCNSSPTTELRPTWCEFNFGDTFNLEQSNWFFCFKIQIN